VRPGVDEVLEAAVNGYEDMIRRSCDLQRALARTLALDLLNTTADLTRDVAAVQVSAARWLLDS
jgi:triphosphoribosyl-dephospho-CoA synthetase